MLAENKEFICIQEPGASLSTDTHYTVLRASPNEHTIYDTQGKLQGYLYQFVAHITLTDQFKADGDVYYRGTVDKSRLGVEPGDLIVAYQSTQRRVSLSKTHGRAAKNQAHIVSFADLGIEFGGEGDLVFIDKGENDGFSKGQVLRVHQKLHQLALQSVLPSDTEKAYAIGDIRIMDTTEAGSIGYILNSTHEVKVGDTVGL